MIYRKLFFISILITGLLVYSLWTGEKSRKSTHKELEHLKVELAHARIAPSIIYDTIRDTVTTTEQAVTTFSRTTYRKEIADKDLLKDVKLKARQIESEMSMLRAIHDTVRLQAQHDSLIFKYQDHWTTFHLSLRDTILQYRIIDSLQTLVFREYRHRLLWWKWGTKGYKVKIINFNPNSHLQYNHYIKVE